MIGAAPTATAARGAQVVRIAANRLSLAEVAAEQGFNEELLLINAFFFDSVVPACCSEGCDVEPDGRCSHGNPSILIAAGVI